MRKIQCSSLLILGAMLLFVTQQSLAQGAAENASKPLGKNILSFCPVYAIPDNNVGIGFSYERLVNDYIGLSVPVMLALGNPYTNVGLEIKLYPTKNTGTARYAIAPSIMYGTGKEKRIEYVYDQSIGTSRQVNVTTERQHFGFVLNQTANFTLMKQFFIGIDGGIGINYYDKRKTGTSEINNVTFAAQFHMALGYRF
jgi:hypothetical protein